MVCYPQFHLTLGKALSTSIKCTKTLVENWLFCLDEKKNQNILRNCKLCNCRLLDFNCLSQQIIKKHITLLT